jgi:hypothetical protein
MNESSWLACTNPQLMLEYLRGKASERKLRLFGSAVCRLVWHLFTDEQARKAIEVVERYADGLASDSELDAATKGASLARDLAYGSAGNALRRHRTRAGRCTSWAAHALACLPPSKSDVYEVTWENVREAIAYALEAEKGRIRKHSRLAANLCRDLFGNPFHPVAVAPSWLVANDAAVIKVAGSLYEEMDSNKFLVLADALEEAGCDCADLLAHCHSREPHARGCWLVDLLLGKK